MWHWHLKVFNGSDVTLKYSKDVIRHSVTYAMGLKASHCHCHSSPMSLWLSDEGKSTGFFTGITENYYVMS